MKKIATYSISCREPVLHHYFADAGYLEKESLALRSGLTPAAVVEKHPASGVSCAIDVRPANKDKIFLASVVTTARSQKTFSLKDSVIYCTVFGLVVERFINRETNLVLQK